MRDLIRYLAKEHAVILSSHILSEISAVCDEVRIINRGKLIVADTTENLARHMENQEMVHLEVKGDKHKVTQLLKAVEGVTKVEFETEKNGFCKFIVYCGDKDLRESIFYTLADAKCPIMSMSISNRSLEDIFLELTGKGSSKKRQMIQERSAAEAEKQEEEE